MFFFKRLFIPTKLTKLCYALMISVLIVVIFCRLHFKHKTKKLDVNSELFQEDENQPTNFIPYDGNLRYIVRWVNPTNKMIEFVEGSRLFVMKSCVWSNCYITDNSNILNSFSGFSVVLFDSPDMNYFENSKHLPKERYQHQKFVFVSGDASSSLPVCNDMWNNYFNWTWTYKLDSDVIWRYLVIRDVKGKIIGPQKDMNWIKPENMLPVDSAFIMKLRSKTKIAAWFASNCKTDSQRENFVKELEVYLAEYNLEVDIYGDCGKLNCPRIIMGRCLEMLEKDYFFYLAFESALSEDYVTDILLHGLKHDAVPVVFGGANYTRFLPANAYLNAQEYGPEGLARRMFELMHSPSQYQKFFRWRNHYSYHAHDESPDSDNFCNLCAAANKYRFDNDMRKTNFKSWWNEKDKCK
ncbi:PREDICTED: alpha-(1,3)-fucosyltransferase C-like [Papilio polytes]|uniref:alpha-(1,3)-fucosyltransferase C-like n=1 Tax=Papilio polytes TaxID=76194 RepID=UPI0006766C14|nr:PREDICTED: alpha-(1,3)-fucosyltransferase C-like [Papilio polytes]